MADSTINALTAATSALVADEMEVNEAGSSKKVTIQQISDLVVQNTTGQIEAMRLGMALP